MRVFLFSVFLSIAYSSIASPSYTRCIRYLYNMITDEPPFNGVDIVVDFSLSYNTTELLETVQLLNINHPGSTLILGDELRKQAQEAMDKRWKHIDEQNDYMKNRCEKHWAHNEGLWYGNHKK